MKNVAKIEEIRDKLSTFILRRNHQNWNLSFHNVLIKYEPRIKDKELHDEKQKIYTIFLFLFLPFKRTFG